MAWLFAQSSHPDAVDSFGSRQVKAVYACESSAAVDLATGYDNVEFNIGYWCALIGVPSTWSARLRTGRRIVGGSFPPSWSWLAIEAMTTSLDVSLV